MITVLCQGGLGNQMFIYAMGLAQAWRLGTNLTIDVTRCELPNSRNYALSLWYGPTGKAIVRHTLGTVKEDGLPYNQSLVDKIKNGDCLEGYWQTERYFQGMRRELLSDFHPRLPMTGRAFDLLRKIGAEGPRSAFLSVRRGDYVNNPIHKAVHGVSLDYYYLVAAARVAAHTPNPHFFVFTDDPEWCKQNFKLPFRFTVVDGIDQTTREHLGREDEDIWMMSRCHHAVMANSSFSWWGAWLSPLPDEDRIVVAPRRWFLTQDLDSKDIIPERWIRI